jgi:hypothetical protein
MAIVSITVAEVSVEKLFSNLNFILGAVHKGRLSRGRKVLNFVACMEKVKTKEDKPYKTNGGGGTQTSS